MSVPVPQEPSHLGAVSLPRQTCPLCGCELDVVVVNPVGELIGCADCARKGALPGETLSLDEWFAPAAVADALGHYGISSYVATKPAAPPTQQPRAQYWEIVAGSTRYFLKRFYEWYPVPAIRHQHSVLSHLAAPPNPLPVPQWVPTLDGKSVVETGDRVWALYYALDGRLTSQQDWMWSRPKAAETLAHLHLKLEHFEPEGEEFQPWGAWTMDIVDSVLESWQPHPDLPADLLGHIRERLATRYFGYLYPELPKLLVHGDYLPANLLWRNDGISSTVSGVLDFEKLHRDTALYDFAWGLGDRRPPLLRATLATYTRVRPMSVVEREALPEALLLGALMGIDMQMTYFRNLNEVTRLAQEMHLLVRDLDSVRRVATAK
ncbi:MAG: phosphotransferase [Ktedonobacterales bacterium]